MNIFAHAGETHKEVTGVGNGLISEIGRLPLLLSLLLISFVLFGLFSLLGVFKINPVTRLLILLPVIIGAGILYMPHQPQVTAIVLSVGFIAAFFLAFAQLTGAKS